MAMTQEALYYALRTLMDSKPELAGRGEFPDATLQWIGRAQALFKSVGMLLTQVVLSLPWEAFVAMGGDGVYRRL